MEASGRAVKLPNKTKEMPARDIILVDSLWPSFTKNVQGKLNSVTPPSLGVLSHDRCWQRMDSDRTILKQW